MTLKAIRHRFSVFLKQFRIDELKLLMKYLEIIVNEYKNAKASRLFELLSDPGNSDQDENEDNECQDISTDDLDISDSKSPRKKILQLKYQQNLKKKKIFEKKQKLKLQHIQRMQQLKSNQTAQEEIRLKSTNSLNSTKITNQNQNESQPIESNQTQATSSISITLNTEQADTDEFTTVNLNENNNFSVEEKNLSDKNDGLNQCVVCGDGATSLRFGPLACDACIEFFRKNYTIHQGFKCVKSTLPFSQSSSIYQVNIANLSKSNEPCKITKETRHVCRRCRMDKSIKLGLKLPNAQKRQDINSQTKEIDTSFEKELEKLMDMGEQENTIASDDLDILLVGSSNGQTQNTEKEVSLENAAKRIKLCNGLDSDSEPPRCSVCTDLATGIRYGVFVCEGCKEFFRRQRENITVKPFQCVTGLNNCVIDTTTRTLCKKCRFDKCVRLGMKLVGRNYKSKK